MPAFRSLKPPLGNALGERRASAKPVGCNCASARYPDVNYPERRDDFNGLSLRLSRERHCAQWVRVKLNHAALLDPESALR